MFHEIRNNCRINVTSPRSHHDTPQRCEAHRSINRQTFINSRNRSTITNMTGDKFQLLKRFAQKFSCFMCYILMTSTMCAIFTYLVFRIIFRWQGITISFFWHSRMERSIKHYHTCNVRQKFLKSTNPCGICWIMKRCQEREFFNLLNDLFIN